jgi:hypothetical protein
LLRPEPAPVGLSVEPLGEALGAKLFPDGFMVVLPFGAVGPVVDVPAPVPTVPPAPVPPTEEPVAAPPAEPPAAPPPACANARVVDIAMAPASAIVMSFMDYPFE